MTSAQSQLARRRLWLGISNVGLWVLAACGALFWLFVRSGDAVEMRVVVALVGAAITAQAVFDFIGGCLLMPRPRPTAGEFLRRWIPGALLHTAMMIGVGLLSYASFVLTSGFALAVLVASVALAFGRGHLLRMIGGAKLAKTMRDGRAEISAVVHDPAFTGGITGFGRRSMSVLPASWLDSRPASELAVESRRRRWQIASGLPARAFLLVLSWNILGTSIGTAVLELYRRAPSDALLGHACWMTLWTFASLLLLPVLSQKAVFAADRAAADSRLDVRDWIKRFASITGEDGSASAGVQTIFYPVPSVAMRLRALEAAQTGFVPGNLARSNLYYSWATLTFLGRAVHCNIGRPALWVFPPSA